jgi:hypothetical protein
MHRSPSADTPLDHSCPAQDDIQIGAGLDFTDPHSPLAPYYLRTSHLVAVSFLGLLFLLMNFMPLWHTDVWGHLKFGQWIWSHGLLPAGNPFCPFLEQEVPSNHYSWLSQALLYGAYHLGEAAAGGDAIHQHEGGIDALRFSHAVLLLARLSVLLLAFRRLTQSLPLALAGVAVFVLLTGANLSIFRPQVAGELCFALLLLAASRLPMSQRTVVIVPLLLALWANLHGSYVVGLLFLGTLVAAKGLETALTKKTLNPRSILGAASVKQLVVVLLLSAAAISVLNPAGPWIWSRTLAMTRHPVVLAMDEWRPLRFGIMAGGHWAYLATGVLTTVSFLYARRRPTLPAMLLIVAFAVPPLFHQRALVWWLILCPWVLLPLWRMKESGLVAGSLSFHSVPSFRKTVLAGLLAVVLLLWSIPGRWLVSGSPAPLERSLSSGTPWELALQLQGERRTDQAWQQQLDLWLAHHYRDASFRGPIFTSETSGDYLLWALPESAPVFIYTHVHLFPAEHWAEVVRVRFGTADWRQVLDRHRINLVVVEAELNPRLRALLQQDKEWQLLLDEADSTAKRDYRCRLLIAVRRQPR